LKPSFNKYAQNWTSAPKMALSRQRPRAKNSGRVMTDITSASFPSPAEAGDGQTLANIGAFWRQFINRAFNPYRPELHYMRGPGPAWRAKHAASSQLHSS
jgi:hypothetical protein